MGISFLSPKYSTYFFLMPPFFFFLIDNSEIFIKSGLQIVHKACTMKQEQVKSS